MFIVGNHMARNEISRLRRRRSGRRVSPAVPTPRAEAPAGQSPDDVALVYAWLRRLTTSVQEAEDLTAAVLTRAGSAGPEFLAAASRQTRLQFLTIQAVLGRRGVL